MVDQENNLWEKRHTLCTELIVIELISPDICYKKSYQKDSQIMKPQVTPS